MYKIKASINVDDRVLITYPDSKGTIEKELLVGFAKEMYTHNCVEITETTENRSGNYLQQDETVFTIEGYVMTHLEFKEAIEMLRMIKAVLQDPFSTGYANRLESILTKEPIS